MTHSSRTVVARLFAAIFISLFLTGPVAVAADDNNGVVLQKSVTPTPDSNGDYWLTLESYVTGKIEVVTDYPGLDVVLVLDYSESMKGDKIKYLKQAATNFVSALASYKGDAKVGAVIFSDDATKLTEGLVSAKEKGADLNNSINAASISGNYTRTNLGMYEGTKMLLDKIKADGDAGKDRKRVLVFFTDGKPNSSKDPTGKYSRDGFLNAADAINYSYLLKCEGGTVYSIGLGVSVTDTITASGSSPSGSEPYFTVKEFLSRVSSEFPDAYIDPLSSLGKSVYYSTYKKNWGYDSSITGTYYQTISSDKSSDLTSIFAAISKEITDIPSIDVTASAVVLDGITSEFKLPDGFAKSSIQTYTSAYNGVDGSGNPQWGALTSFSATKDFKVNTNGTTSVTVTNFNFGDNWCGSDNGKPHGKKLVIKIPITPKPETIGGLNIPTNTEDSGLYFDSKQTEALAYFTPQHVDIPKKLTIRKNGLQAGESAIFKISQITEDKTSVYKFTVMLTGVKGKDYVETTIKGLDPHYEYNVTETDWSWSYSPSGSTSITTDENSKNPLVFTNVKNTEVVKNAEAMVENKFQTIPADK